MFYILYFAEIRGKRYKIVNCKNQYNPCAPYGSQCNPVVIESFTNEGTYDLIQPVSPFLSTINPQCRCFTFYLALPQSIPYGDTLPIVYSEDGGTTLVDVYDRVGDYVRADRIIDYDTRKCLLKVVYFQDPAHLNVLSEICHTHYLPPAIP